MELTLLLLGTPPTISTERGGQTFYETAVTATATVTAIDNRHPHHQHQHRDEQQTQQQQQHEAVYSQESQQVQYH